MRAIDITPYFNMNKMSVQMRDEIISTLARWAQPPRSPANLRRQYGDEMHDLKIERARLEIDLVRAETEKIKAEAAARRAEVQAPISLPTASASARSKDNPHSQPRQSR